jgi:hypothetical protein
MAKHFDLDYYATLNSEAQTDLIRCCRSGIDNADSGMGCCKNQNMPKALKIPYYLLLHCRRYATF